MPLILCNAQPFGFGPSAILFTLYPWLKRLTCLTANPLEFHYVGSRHSLELHKRTPWRQVHHCDVNSKAGADALTELCKRLQPAIFLTIMDPEAAAAAHKSGTTVVVVDALLWYWREIPPSWSTASRVIALDFFGVAERIQQESLQRNVVRVPPLLPTSSLDNENWKEISVYPILINLGGLENPHTSISVNVAYAKLVIDAVDSARKSLVKDNGWRLQRNSIIILASEAVCQGLGDGRACTLSPEQSRQYLRTAQCVFLTPGYGNILDAADLNPAAYFLPPAAATQSRQLASLRSAGMVSYAIEWHEMLESPWIDYWMPGAEGLLVVIDIIQKASKSDKFRANFRDFCRVALMEAHQESQPAESRSLNKQAQPLRALFDHFGKDDGSILMEKLCEAVPDLGLRLL